MADVTADVAGRTLRLTNLDKVLYPCGFTKGEVIEYYRAIASVMLPHLSGRPVTRVRFPHGTTGPSFFEKNVPAAAPAWLQRQVVDGTDGAVIYPLINDVPTLVYMANLAALELHTPQWRTPDEGAPVRLSPQVLIDQVVMDLDPGADVTMPLIALAALLVAGEFAEAGLRAYPKTSGHKGIQVYAPVAPTPAGTALTYITSVAGTLNDAASRTLRDHGEQGGPSRQDPARHQPELARQNDRVGLLSARRRHPHGVHSSHMGRGGGCQRGSPAHLHRSRRPGARPSRWGPVRRRVDRSAPQPPRAVTWRVRPPRSALRRRHGPR